MNAVIRFQHGVYMYDYVAVNRLVDIRKDAIYPGRYTVWFYEDEDERHDSECLHLDETGMTFVRTEDDHTYTADGRYGGRTYDRLVVVLEQERLKEKLARI